MSKWVEYLKLIPAGLKNADKVLEGIVNDIKLNNDSLPEDEKEEIIRRRLICETCPFMSENAVASGIYTTQRKDKHCIQCGCPIFSKTASLTANCGIEFYNQRNPNNKLELKWTTYTKEKPNDNYKNETNR